MPGNIFGQQDNGLGVLEKNRNTDEVVLIDASQLKQEKTLKTNNSIICLKMMEKKL